MERIKPDESGKIVIFTIIRRKESGGYSFKAFFNAAKFFSMMEI